MFLQLPLIKPMLAVPAQPFSSPKYLYEVKWDGYRALLYLHSTATRVFSRNLKLLNETFPEILTLHKQVSYLPIVLDGEIVALANGSPSFGALQTRSRLKGGFKVEQAVKKNPALFIAFDVLYLSGTPVMELPLVERKELLKKIITAGNHLLLSQYITGEGKEFYHACIKRGLEGVVAKEITSPYLPGKRSSYWKKIRNIKTTELVICGYEQGAGGLGALILGGMSDNILVYQGKVGTGFKQQEKEHLISLLKSIQINLPPLVVPKIELQQPIWVQPLLVCEVQYTEVTVGGRLRHPSYKGLRTDKEPKECLAIN